MAPLRGRDSECAVLARLAASAAVGAGGVVLVEGAAGIGKTRLLAEAARIAAAQEVQVAGGGCDELDQVTPWAPLLRALSAAPPVLLGEADLVPVRSLADQRLAVIERIRAALEKASRRRPVLVALDDLQWADPATLMALGSLPAQLFSQPVAWVLAFQPVPASPRLESLVARLAEAGAIRLHLGPLDADAAAAMAADVLGTRPAASVTSLVLRAGGNPLYITELLRSSGGTPSGELVRSPSPWLPVSLRAAVAAHLRSLPEPSRNLLKVASVLGREFTVVDLAAMSGQPAGLLMSPLAQALAAEVIIEVGDRLAFRHDLFRQAVYQDVPVLLRRGLHRDAATMLLAQGASTVRVATHLALGALPGDEQAVSVLIEAMGELAPTSASAAADLGLRVLDLTDAGDPRRPGLVATTVSLLGWASRGEEAQALGESFLVDHPQPAALEAEIHHGMRQAWSMTTHARYPVPLPRHLAADPGVPGRIRADLIGFEQVGALWEDPADVVERALEQAAALIADHREQASLDLLGSVRVALAQEHGCFLDALAMAESRAQLAQQGRPGLAGGLCESTIASCLRALGRPGQALEMLAQAQQSASASGYTFIVGRCQSIRVLVLLELGRLDDVRAEAQAAARTAEELGLGYFLGQALATLAEASIRQGDLTAATAAADRLTASGRPDVVTGDHHWVTALCADARGKPETALAALTPVTKRLRHGRFYFAAWYPSRLAQLASLAMRAGNREQAGDAARAAAELAARNPGVAPLFGAATHTRGIWQSDAGALREAAGLFSCGERPLATAAAQEDLGRVLAGTGHKDEAVAALEAAYATYLSANATRDLARVRGALHALGVRKRQAPIARPAHGWESLTRGELAVVEVVAQGLTNRETAAQLYLSADTVNSHLRHAFAKLGIRSRVELARLAADRERTPGPARH